MIMTAAHGGAGNPESDAVWSVESHGIDLIPESDRHGRTRELLWVWMGANLVFVYLVSGAVLIALGLTFWQSVAAVLLGSVLFVLVGWSGIPGPRTGTATMVVSRSAFGLRGNIAPTFLSWLTVVGWQAVYLALGTYALIALAEEVGLEATDPVKAMLLAAIVVVTYGVAVLGHATIVFLQRLFTYGLGLLMLGVLVQVVPDADLGFSTGELAGSTGLATFALGVILVAALPLSYVNYGADYTRYLPRGSAPRELTLWPVLGSAIPAVGIMLIGVMAATAADLTDPIGGLKPLLASWYFIPFLVVVIGGCITNNFLNTYTSGLTLQALGVTLPRPKTVIIDGVIASAAAAYAVFFHDFTSTFIEFLSLMIIWIAPWAAVYLVDMWLRRASYEPADLMRSSGGRYWYRGGVHVAALAAWGAGMVGAFLLTNSTRWQSPVSTDLLGGADLSIPVGLIVAGATYYALRPDTASQEVAEPTPQGAPAYAETTVQ
jgi:NCS1 nucleoside transporter family